MKGEIDALKNSRSLLINQIRDKRRRLRYKENELVTVSRSLELDKDKSEAERSKARKLRRIKERLEFRISTEAASLTSEKELIRKINEVDAQLNEALKYVRLERKSGLVKRDIDECKQSIFELNKEITALDSKLDELYDRLRSVLGIHRNRESPEVRRKQQTTHQQEINLEDIAVITRK